MTFSSLSFLLLFAIILVLQRAPWSWAVKKSLLIVFSFVFYGAWRPEYCLLLAYTAVADFYVAKRIAAAETRAGKTAWLSVSLVSSLGLLGYFKYANFVLSSAAELFHVAGVQVAVPTLDVVLPVGISFYTFQTISYTVDVYRGVLPAEKKFLDYALYVAFFPQLVAGPIVRASDFLPQTRRPPPVSTDAIAWGLTLFVVGLWQKTVLADGLLAPVVQWAYGAPKNLSFGGAWMGTLAFSGQIFFDFAGYSSCAIGVARCLGFELTTNFRLPYGAIGFSDFWRRWHISLSTWLREYLYIPLGGNREGTWRAHRNLMLTMLIGGLWHGASWNFVIWGGLHGLYLVVERILRGIIPTPSSRVAGWLLRSAGGALTFLAVCFAWVFFRAPSLDIARRICGAMLRPELPQWPASLALVTDLEFQFGIALLVVALLLIAHAWWREKGFEQSFRSWSWPLRGVAIAAMLLSITTMSGEDRAFIYFQF